MTDSPKFQRLLGLTLSMGKFGLTSALASVIDLCVFMFVTEPNLPLFHAEVVAAFCGMVVNFFMHKKFVFQLQRKAYVAFILSITFSVVVLLLGGLLMQQLGNIGFFATYIVLAKLLVMGSKFSLNYFSKRWVFERRLFR